MRDDNSYLLDMLIAARKIQEFVTNLSEENFRQSDLHQSAVIREFQVIGKAARLLTDSLKDSHPQIDWAKISGMRNRLVHEYFRISLQILWDAAQNDIPILIGQLEEIVPPDDN